MCPDGANVTVLEPTRTTPPDVDTVSSTLTISHGAFASPATTGSVPVKPCQGAGCLASLRSEPKSSTELGRSAQLRVAPREQTETDRKGTASNFHFLYSLSRFYSHLPGVPVADFMFPTPFLYALPKVLSSVRVLPDLTCRPTAVLGVLVAVPLRGVGQTLGFTSQMPDFCTKKMGELPSFPVSLCSDTTSGVVLPAQGPAPLCVL